MEAAQAQDVPQLIVLNGSLEDLFQLRPGLDIVLADHGELLASLQEHTHCFDVAEKATDLSVIGPFTVTASKQSL